MLDFCPITFREACDFIQEHHRHHPPPLGWKFGIGVTDGEKLVGVVTVGRPVARGLDNGKTLEVTRLCTDGTRNAASKLYGWARREAKRRGYNRIVTYILNSESGISLRAAGWHEVTFVKGRSWNCVSRPRNDKHPTVDKRRWQAIL